MLGRNFHTLWSTAKDAAAALEAQAMLPWLLLLLDPGKQVNSACHVLSFVELACGANTSRVSLALYSSSHSWMFRRGDSSFWDGAAKYIQGAVGSEQVGTRVCL